MCIGLRRNVFEWNVDGLITMVLALSLQTSVKRIAGLSVGELAGRTDLEERDGTFRNFEERTAGKWTHVWASL